MGNGLLRGRSLREALGDGVSLGVAAVPEGLPFVANAAALAGARRLSSRGALVGNPAALETLGRVDVLCFDKTGTLTEGRISLAAIADPTGEPTPVEQLTGRQRQTLVAALRATPRRHNGQPLAHLTDRAIANGAHAVGVAREDDLPGWRRLTALPFEPSRGYHATLGAQPGAETALLSVKGAPETVLPRCTQLRDVGRPSPLRERQRARVQRRSPSSLGRVTGSWRWLNARSATAGTSKTTTSGS
jgi:cation-transporting ATPase I